MRPAVRVSRAAAAYSYCGAAVYHPAQRKADGVWTWRCERRARSDRRSIAGAERDAAAVAERLTAQGERVARGAAIGGVVPTVRLDACSAAPTAARCA